MKKQVPFGRETLWVDIPDNQLVYYADMVEFNVTQSPDEMVESALDHPYGTDRLENLVNAGQKVMIISDDITRPTPKRLLITHILARLEKAGILKSDITICLAPGTHRKMSEQEMLDTYGKEMLDEYSFLNLNYKDVDHLVDFGKTPSGIEIEIYREVVESDFVIGIGNIVPHVSAGWGGGAKIIQPGVCGEKTTEATHRIAALDQNVMETCGNADNQCRHEMEEIAARAGLKFIVNTVMNSKEELAGVFCGDFIAAHRAGIEKAKLVQCPAIPCRADIVIASANPCNIDFWQGDKPFVFAQYGIKDNGTLIFVISGEEGVCGNAPEHEYVVRKYALLGEKRVREDVDNGTIKDVIAIDNAIHLEQVRDRGVNVLLVSKGFTEKDAKDLGFEKVPSIEVALDRAYARQGRNATVGIIPYCGETLVEVR